MTDRRATTVLARKLGHDLLRVYESRRAAEADTDEGLGAEIFPVTVWAVNLGEKMPAHVEAIDSGRASNEACNARLIFEPIAPPAPQSFVEFCRVCRGEGGSFDAERADHAPRGWIPCQYCAGRGAI